jgi:hypothetical protein
MSGTITLDGMCAGESANSNARTTTRRRRVTGWYATHSYSECLYVLHRYVIPTMITVAVEACCMAAFLAISF